MTDTGYLLWLIAMAAATTTLLTLGTLRAAELLPFQRHGERRRARRTPGSEEVSS